MAALHALLIDDDANNLGVLAEMLTMEGISSTSLENPANLMKTLGKLSKVDLVFLDLEMPHSNGYEVLDVLKHHMGLEIPVVACTVHSGEVNTAKELGFHSFLVKPLDFDRFPMQLKRILRNERVWEVV